MRVSDKIRLGWLLLHLGLISAVCLHESLWLVEKHLTIVTSGRSERIWKSLDQLPTAVLGSSLSSTNPYRRAIQTYLNAAGVEIGYGYFAPNVPDAHAIVFEWTFADGHTEYDAPTVEGNEARLRLTSLIDQIAQADYAPWRNELMRRVTIAAWVRHPHAISARAFLGSMAPPTLAEYRAGKREAVFVCQSVYNFKKNAGRIESSAP